MYFFDHKKVVCVVVKKTFVVFQQYGSKDLAGLRIEHGASEFEDGSSVIVTLKDSGMHQ